MKNDNLLSHPISIYENTYQTITKKLINYSELQNYFIEDKIKSERKTFIFNTIIDETLNNRTKQNFTTSPWIVVDIDIKDEKSFLKDTTLTELYNFFKNDKHCFTCGYSASGKGLRAIYSLKGNYNILSNIDDNDIDYETQLNIWKYKNFIEYMKSNNFNNCETYIDQAFVRNHAQATYSLKNANFKDFEILEPTIPFKTKIIHTKYTQTECNYKDWNWSETRLNLFKTKLVSFGHVEILSWLSALQLIHDDQILHDFFVWFRRDFVGKSKYKYLKDKETFLNIVKNRKWTQFNANLELLLKNNGVKIIKNISKIEENISDIFNRKYDKTYYYNNYLSELNIDLSDKEIVIRADAGAGKTTIALEYCKTINGIRIFATPTNVLSNQVYEKCLKEFKNIKIMKFFDKQYDGLEDGIIITNYSNLSKLEKRLELKNVVASVLFLDECHRLTDYSIFLDEQIIFPKSNKIIYLSATPEPFLMGEKDYTYIYCKKNIEYKRDITMIRCANYQQIRSTIGKSLLNTTGTTNMIFYNNKDGNQKFIDSLKKYNIIFDKIDSKNKGKAYDNLIKNQIIRGNTIVTSLVNDGVNILNKKIDNIYIIDNHTQSVFDIYQFLQRFRNCEPNIFYMFVGGASKKSEINLNYELFDENYRVIKENSKSDILKLKKGVFYEEDKLKLSFIYKFRGKYLINKNQIKQKLYNDWKSEIRNNIILFEKMLDKYFNVRMKSFIKYNKHIKIDKNEHKEFILKNLEKIILHKNDNINPNFNIEEQNIYEECQNLVRKVVERTKKIKKFDGNIEDFNLFSNSVIFKTNMRTLQMEWNNKNEMKSTIENTIYENYNSINDILKIGMKLEDIKSNYNNVVKDLLNDSKLNFDNVKKLNQQLKCYNVKFNRKKVNQERKYVLGIV